MRGNSMKLLGVTKRVEHMNRGCSFAGRNTESHRQNPITLNSR